MKTNLWDWYAAIGYDAITVLLPYTALQRAVLAAIDLRPGNRLLVAGCGTGNFEFLAASTVTDLAVEAVDFSPAMLARANQKCRVFPAIHHQQANLCAMLPFPDESFDAVVMCNVLYALPDQERALREIHRVLQPGGRFVLCDRHPWSTTAPIMQAHLASVRALPLISRLRHQLRTLAALPTLVGVGVINNLIQHRHQEGQYHFFAEEEIATLLDTIGFAVTGFQPAYADQCWLAQCVRQSSHRAREASP